MNFEQLAIQAAQEELIKFCLVYDKNYVVNWHHRLIAQALQKVEEGKIKRLMIKMPPRHGKSQLGSIYFPAWYLGRNPTKRIITASYASDLASDFGSQTRDIIKDSQYQAIFNTKLKEDSKSKNKWHTQDGGFYISVGVGGAITGRGADVLVIDDPLKNREEAESKVYRDKVDGWYKSTAYTRLEKDGAIIVIQTQWHIDDLAGRLEDRMLKGGDEWHVLTLPAIAEEDEEYRKEGEALWPDKYDEEALANIKANIGVYDWQALYQQRPISLETQEFKKDNFYYFRPEDVRHKELYYYTMVDLAGQKDGADDNAIVTVAKELDKPEIYVMDIKANVMDPGTLIDYCFSIKSRYGHRHVRFGVETVAYQQSMMYWMREEQRKREEYFDIIELKAASKKETRIRGLKAMYEAGVILHNSEDPYISKLEEQLLTFPQSPKDDVMDALAYFPQVVKKTTRKSRVRKPHWKGYGIKA